MCSFKTLEEGIQIIKLFRKILLLLHLYMNAFINISQF